MPCQPKFSHCYCLCQQSNDGRFPQVCYCRHNHSVNSWAAAPLGQAAVPRTVKQHQEPRWMALCSFLFAAVTDEVQRIKQVCHRAHIVVNKNFPLI